MFLKHGTDMAMMSEHAARGVREGQPAPWRGRLFLWEGRGLYLGPTFATDMHAHHAAQICVALTGTFRLRSGHNASWFRSRSIIIPADHAHQLDGEGGVLSLLFLDPEAVETRALMQQQGAEVRTIPEPTLRRLLPPLRRCWREQWDNHESEILCRRFIQILIFPGNVPRPLDPRITQAVQLFRANTDRRMTIAEAAAAVALSPSRLAHLFRAHMGLAVRRYLLWLRLAEALQKITCGVSLTVAAHAAGFADSAHLSRTFRRMFGLVPSMLSRHSTFVQASSGEAPYSRLTSSPLVKDYRR
ncbi:MAG: helix-turn-helix transcriptional regulator [Deltaproteobacteria bacterium]|nr:helix-turn-helix transcriptional regulator [Deltaproteobacteria bacterium]